MRIVTYNIRGGLGMDGLRDTVRIAELVGSLEPDIACFQEVHQRLPWSGWIDQPRILSRCLRMPFVFQKCVSLPWGGYGLGIATRFPIRRVQRHRLASRKEPRGALRVEVLTPQGPLDVLCTHWGLDDQERAQQAKQMEALINATHPPVIVCGDLNDTPAARYIQAMLDSAGMADAGQAQNAPTYPSDAPRARIDFVLYPGKWSAVKVSAVQSLLSDHLPLVVDLDYGAGGGLLERLECELK